MFVDQSLQINNVAYVFKFNLSFSNKRNALSNYY